MKKILVAALMLVAGVAHAKSHSQQDDVTPTSPACMIEVSTVTVSRFVNVLYIREIEVKNEARNGLPGTDLAISMASNYGNTSEFKITYPTNRAAMDAMRSFVKQINECRRG